MRHTHAYYLLRDRMTSSLCNPDLHYLVELAYQEYAVRPWKWRVSVRHRCYRAHRDD